MFASVQLFYGHYTLGLAVLVTELLRPENPADFSLALPAGPVFPVKFHKPHRTFNRFLFGLQLELRIAADHLFSLREWAIDHLDLPSGQPDARALGGGGETAVAEYGAGFYGLFGKLPDGFHQLLGGRARVLGVL